MITKDFIAKQKTAIEKKIEVLNQTIQENKQFEEVGSADEDNAREFEEFEERTALDKGANSEIKNLKKALSRIEDGTYGKCKACDEPIEIGRLKVYPEAELCATHAKKKPL